MISPLIFSFKDSKSETISSTRNEALSSSVIVFSQLSLAEAVDEMLRRGRFGLLRYFGSDGNICGMESFFNRSLFNLGDSRAFQRPLFLSCDSVSQSSAEKWLAHTLLDAVTDKFFLGIAVIHFCLKRGSFGNRNMATLRLSLTEAYPVRQPGTQHLLGITVQQNSLIMKPKIPKVMRQHCFFERSYTYSPDRRRQKASSPHIAFLHHIHLTYVR